MARNWKAMESAQEAIQKIIKRRKKTSNFIKSDMGDDEIYDPLKNTVVKICDCTESTLNRLIKSLNAMYKATEASDIEIRDVLIKKKVQLEKELESRIKEEKKTKKVGDKNGVKSKK